MNPSNFIVNNIKENDIHVYIICPDKKDAEEIETLTRYDQWRTNQVLQCYAQAAAERQQKSDDVDGGDESEKSEEENESKGPTEDSQKMLAEKNEQSNSPQDDEFQIET